jgi:hypothetical protein
MGVDVLDVHRASDLEDNLVVGKIIKESSIVIRIEDSRKVTAIAKSAGMVNPLLTRLFNCSHSIVRIYGEVVPKERESIQPFSFVIPVGQDEMNQELAILNDACVQSGRRFPYVPFSFRWIYQGCVAAVNGRFTIPCQPITVDNAEGAATFMRLTRSYGMTHAQLDIVVRNIVLPILAQNEGGSLLLTHENKIEMVVRMTRELIHAGSITKEDLMQTVFPEEF